MRFVADTSAIIAAIIKDEPRHIECRTILDEAAHVFITPYVTAEVFYLLNSVGHYSAALSFLLDIAEGFYEVVNPDATAYQVARDLIIGISGKLMRKKTKTGSLDLANAMNIVIAAQQETTIIASLDQDYRQVEPLNGPRFFTLLPEDAVIS